MAKRLRRKGRIVARALSVLLIIVLGVVLVAYLFNLFVGEGGLTDVFQTWTKQNRALSYVLYLVIAPLINLVPGISSMFTIALANMLFNYKTPADMALTFGLCATTVVITSSLMFLVGRLGGKRIVEWIAGKENTRKFQRYLTLGGKAVIPMMYTLPFFPDDTLCLIAGMTDMSFLYNFVCSLLFRNFGVLFMCVVGTVDYHAFTWQMWLGAVFGFLVLLVVLAVVSYFYYRHLRYKEEGFRFLLAGHLRTTPFYVFGKARRKELPALESLLTRAKEGQAWTLGGDRTDAPTLREAYMDSCLYVLRHHGDPISFLATDPDGKGVVLLFSTSVKNFRILLSFLHRELPDVVLPENQKDGRAFPSD